jgi:sRNA-binding regulator protein Hfq
VARRQPVKVQLHPGEPLQGVLVRRFDQFETFSLNFNSSV